MLTALRLYLFHRRGGRSRTRALCRAIEAACRDIEFRRL
jgi:hypothetical protein